jgi:hypothetical protein
MRIEETPYGTLFVEATEERGLVKAIRKGLSWTKEIETGSDVWRTDRTMEHGIRLTRTYKGCSISVYPLVAATLDVGGRFRTFPRGHLPVQVNGENVCVVWAKRSSNRYHIDAVASFVALFSSQNPPPNAIPDTIDFHLVRASVGLELSRDTTDLDRLVASFLPKCGGSASDAIAFLDDVYTDSEWELLREGFPWRNHVPLGLEIATSMLANSSCPRNLRWAVKMVAHYQPVLLPSLFSSKNVTVAHSALTAYEASCPDEAWGQLSKFLHEDNILGLAAHQKLVIHSSLSGRLREFWSAKLRNNRLVNVALRQTVESWFYFYKPPNLFEIS